ncbi:peptidylprolyl isomerase [Candidatus Latescibacterota bacterium]
MQSSHTFFTHFLTLCVVLAFVQCSGEKSEPVPQKPVQYRLRQIMLEPSISTEREAAIKQQAAAILQQANSGEDFTALAKQHSQEPGADRTGGDLGFFTFDQMVGPFSKVVFDMRQGEIRGPVKTQFGYHVIKLHTIQDDKRHAQHILLMLTPDRTDSLRVMETLAGIRQRIIGGEPFETMLERYNTYDMIKETSGFMVWQRPGDMLPSYVKAIEGLGVGDVSAPFVSIIGMHIVQVDSINHDPDNLLSGFPAHIEAQMK